jgi:hypothetical protein
MAPTPLNYPQSQKQRNKKNMKTNLRYQIVTLVVSSLFAGAFGIGVITDLLDSNTTPQSLDLILLVLIAISLTYTARKIETTTKSNTR